MSYIEREGIKKRDALVKQGILRCDNRGNLRIYTYVNWCKQWDDITLNSRGIIYNLKSEEIVAQPFPKFFNMNQRDDTQEWRLPWRENFRIFKKEDGWLGILYRYSGHYYIATRGSFHSIGAIWASKFLKRYNLEGLPNNVTLVFEIICPATHIVVDYGNREDLILLAAYNRHTGEEYNWEYVERWSKEFGFTLAESYGKNWFGYCRGQLKNIPGNQLEGFVVRFKNGLRVKIKSEDYFRRHRIISQLTPLFIWSVMVNGCVPEEIYNQTEIEYISVINEIASILETQYRETKTNIYNQFNNIPKITDRAIFAKHAVKTKDSSAMFIILDQHEVALDSYIMKKIRPRGNKYGLVA